MMTRSIIKLIFRRVLPLATLKDIPGVGKSSLDLLGRACLVTLAGFLLLLHSGQIKAQTSPVELYEFVFVEFGGRPGHQGYAPRQGVPASGQQAAIRVKLFGPVLSARAEFINAAGVIVALVPLTRPAGGAPDTPEFYGNVVVPKEPFRVSINGQELSGKTFAVGLKAATLYTPKSLQIEIVSLASVLSPGTPARFYVSVANYGASDTFSVLASDTPSSLLTISENSISLASQQTAMVEISNTIPTDTNSLPFYKLVVTVTGIASKVTNSVTTTLELASQRGQRLNVIVNPGSCDVIINSRQRGLTPVVIVASADFDPTNLDPRSIYIAGNVAPDKILVQDVGVHKERSKEYEEHNDNNCNQLFIDGRNDLLLSFDTKLLYGAVSSMFPKRVGKPRRDITIPLSARTRNGVDSLGFVRIRLDD